MFSSGGGSGAVRGMATLTVLFRLLLRQSLMCKELSMEA